MLKLKTINIALSPNNTWRDTLEAAAQLVLPWNWWSWRRGRAVVELETRFAEYHGVKRAWAVGSGREALYVILKSLNLKPGEEVILQSFTCMVVVNSIVWNGLKPVFCDIDESYNLSADALRAKITSKTRAVIVQHTFGIPAQLDKIRKICHERGLILIEDCAHALGADIAGRKVGTMGDFGFYSLGRSKVISAVSGGMIICNNEKYLSGLDSLYSKLADKPVSLILQNLLHPLICSIAKPTYGIWIGKLLMVIGQKLKLLSFEVTKAEKLGVSEGVFPTKMPNALAKLALIQFQLLDNFNKHRRYLSKIYFDGLKVGSNLSDPDKYTGAIYLRYPLLVTAARPLLLAAKNAGIILGDWYSTPVAPPDIDHVKSGYQNGENPSSEKVCLEIINLPTQQNISESDAERIINFLNNYVSN